MIPPLTQNAVSGGRNYGFFNSALSRGQGFGGAVCNYNGVVTFSRSYLTANAATNGGGVYNLGDGATGILGLDGASITNNSPLDFVQNELNAGFATTLAHGDTITRGVPWLRDIPDQRVTGPVSLAFQLSAPVGDPSDRTVTVASDNPSYLSASNLALSVNATNATLDILPPATGGSANITVALADGNLSYVNTFNFTLNFDLAVTLYSGELLTLPIFATNSPLDHHECHPGNQRRRHLHRTETLTYDQNVPNATTDAFTYVFTRRRQHFDRSRGSHHSGHGPACQPRPRTAGPAVCARRSRWRMRRPADNGASAWDAALAGQTILLDTIGDTNLDASALSVSGDITIDGAAAPGVILARDPRCPVYAAVPRRHQRKISS